MSTEAPAAPVKKTLTDEQKAKMAAGRRAALAKKAASPSDVEARLAALDTKFDAVMAALAKLSAPVAPAPAARPAGRLVEPIDIAPSAPVSATRGVEAAFVYMTRQGEKRERVNLRITDPDDGRWENELLKAPFNGDPQGALEVAIVTRVDGEISGQPKDIFGGPMHMNVARSFIQRFTAAKAAGSAKPWDLERYFRDKREEEARLKREGKLDELLAMRTLMVEALKGVIPTESVAA